MGPTWGRQDPGGPHVGLMNLAIRVVMLRPNKIVLLLHEGLSLKRICYHFDTIFMFLAAYRIVTVTISTAASHEHSFVKMGTIACT